MYKNQTMFNGVPVFFRMLSFSNKGHITPLARRAASWISHGGVFTIDREALALRPWWRSCCWCNIIIMSLKYIEIKLQKGKWEIPKNWLVPKTSHNNYNNKLSLNGLMTWMIWGPTTDMAIFRAAPAARRASIGTIGYLVKLSTSLVTIVTIVT